MIILGIDPGYERLGWGVIKKSVSLEYIDCGVIRTSPTDTAASRLFQASKELQQVIEKHQPTHAAVESLFFFKNQKTVIQVAQARGMILTCLAEASLNIFEFTPPQIKSIVAGDGQASKKGVEKMVRLQLPGVPLGMLDDTLDALGAALALACQNIYV